MADGFIAPDVKVMVQGITGRVGSAHTRNMLAYGTNIVGGVSPSEDSSNSEIPSSFQ